MASKKVQRLSGYLNVPRDVFKKAHILDPVIGVDVKVFVDPQRLLLTKIPDFKDSREKIKERFTKIFRGIVQSKKYEDEFWVGARKLVMVKEITGVGIGFCSDKDTGNAIGKILADQLLKTASFIYKHGVADPIAFELLGLFEKNFGPDRLSDLTIEILRADFLAYTQKTASLLAIPAKHRFSYIYKGHAYDVPFRVNKKGKKYPVTLLPEDVLRDLPVALDPSQINEAADLKRELHDYWGEVVRVAWEETRERPTKEDRRKLFLEHPEFFDPLIVAYLKNQKPAYDFDADPNGLLKWFDAAGESVAANPLNLNKKITSPEELLVVVTKIVKQFAKNIELNGLNKSLYDKIDNPLHEEYAQRLFFTVADGYCAANNLDISPESDAGRGPVDFKMSSGGDKIIVEIKLSKHSRLIPGYKKQVRMYKESEGAIQAHYVVIRVNAIESAQLKELKKLDAEAKKNGEPAPILTIIDGLLYPSASKA